MANPTTNFGWVMPTSSSLVTNLPADFNTFGQAVDTSMSELLGGTTGQVLSKTSNTNMDFTWVTPTDQTPLTTKGDLFTFTTVDARLGVGTNGQTLVADSAEATGLKWATPSVGALTLVTSGTFSSVTSFSVNNCFSATYKNYLIFINPTSTSATNTFKLRVGGVDASTAYYYGNLAQPMSATGPTSTGATNTTSWALGTFQNGYAQKINVEYPAVAVSTSFDRSVVDTNGATGNFNNGGGWHNTATAYDGFTITLVSAGSGNYYVYGYGV